jgi:hypothetical protein
VAADDGAQRAAAGQQAVTAAMRVLVIALATALVLRTGALQFFVSALSGAAKSSGGSAGAASAGAAAAAASAFLVPGLRRRLLSPAAQLLGALGSASGHDHLHLAVRMCCGHAHTLRDEVCRSMYTV